MEEQLLHADIPSLNDLNKNDQEYFHIDEVENAIDSLETACFFLERSDSLKWKWFALSLHHSLYSFCIACLVNGNYDNVLSTTGNDENNIVRFGNDKPRKSKILKRPNSPGYKIEWYEAEEDINLLDAPNVTTKKAPKKSAQKLIGFWTALARVQDDYCWMRHLIHTKALILTEEEWNSIEWLTIAVRNNFVHFLPCFLSISIDSIKKTCLDVLRAIEFLAIESNAVLYIDHDKSKSRIRNAIDKIRNSLNKENGKPNV